VFVEVVVLCVMLVMCKVYGGVYIVMNLCLLGVMCVFVWLGVELVVMGVVVVVWILYCCKLVEVFDDVWVDVEVDFVVEYE